MTKLGPRPGPTPSRPVGPPPRTAEALSAAIDRRMSQAAERDRVFGFGGLPGMVGLAILGAAPLGWALNHLGLIPGPIGFARGPGGRALALAIGRDLVMPAYWLGLGLAGYALQICRTLVPLLLVGGLVWWSWLGLSLAHEAGLIAMPISPPAAR